MSDLERELEFSSARPKTAASTALNIGKKALACGLAYLMIPLGIGDLYAQSAPPPPPDQGQYQDQAPPPPDQQGDVQDQDQGPPPQAYNPLPVEQLDQLVAPIALYPDALVAQILAASTYPTQVADADHFVQANAGAPPDQLGEMANGMNWDPSVKALVAFPSVLNNLDRNLDWTSQLGNAYYNQPQDVMAAVQDMRARAYAAGNLRSTPQYSVQYEPGDIVIAPANPAVVYVPWYNPWVVYGAPIGPWGGYYVAPRPAGLFFAAGLGIGFGVGIAIGHWDHWGWGWHNWGMGWRDRTIVYQRNVYISNSVHVVNHGYYGHFDHNPQARAYNHRVFVRAVSYNRVNNINRENNYNRTNNMNRTNNYNRPNNAARPSERLNYNNRPQARPENNRPQARPENNYRPQARPENNYRPQARPENNYRPQARPENNYRPQARPENNHRPQARPENNYRPQARPNNNYRQNNARPQNHPQERQQSRPAAKQEKGHDRGR